MKNELFGEMCAIPRHVGFASYSLQNNNANIRTTKKRLEDLEALHNEEPLQANGDAMGTDWELFEEDGRIKFSFDGIPAEEVRKKLSNDIKVWNFCTS